MSALFQDAATGGKACLLNTLMWWPLITSTSMSALFLDTHPKTGFVDGFLVGLDDGFDVAGFKEGHVLGLVLLNLQI